MSDASYYNWKVKYGGITVSELRRLKALEAENRRLKQLMAEQALHKLTLKELLARKLLTPRTSKQEGHIRGDRS